MANEATGQNQDGQEQFSAWNDLYEALNADRKEVIAPASRGAEIVRSMRERLVNDRLVEAAQSDPQSSVVRLEPVSSPSNTTQAKRRRFSFDAARQSARDAYARTGIVSPDDAARIAPRLVDNAADRENDAIRWDEPKDKPHLSLVQQGQPETSGVDVVWRDASPEEPNDIKPVFGRRTLSADAQEPAHKPAAEPKQAAPVAERLLLGVPPTAIIRYREADFHLASLDRPAANPATLAFPSAGLPQPAVKKPEPAGFLALELPSLTPRLGRYLTYGLAAALGLAAVILIVALAFNTGE